MEPAWRNGEVGWPGFFYWVTMTYPGPNMFMPQVIWNVPNWVGVKSNGTF